MCEIAFDGAEGNLHKGRVHPSTRAIRKSAESKKRKMDSRN